MSVWNHRLSELLIWNFPGRPLPRILKATCVHVNICKPLQMLLVALLKKIQVSRLEGPQWQPPAAHWLWPSELLRKSLLLDWQLRSCIHAFTREVDARKYTNARQMFHKWECATEWMQTFCPANHGRVAQTKWIHITQQCWDGIASIIQIKLGQNSHLRGAIWQALLAL